MARFQDFQDFWPYYLKQHTQPLTRALHYIGTAGAIGLLVTAVVMRDWRYAAAAPIAGYGFAWISHLAVERNRPATFRHPLWSLMGDFKMLVFAVGGLLQPELDKARINRWRGQRIGRKPGR